MRLLWTTIVVQLLLIASVAQGGSPAREAVLRDIAALERQYGGHLGVMAVNLRTGDTVAYNAAERFPTASAIKFPIMAAFFTLVDQRKIDPGVKVLLRQEDKKPGSGILQFMGEEATITLLDAVRLMIILSDNTATNLVIDRLGGTHEERLRAVNEAMTRHGLKNTRLLNRLYSWKTKQNTPEAVRYGIGVSTPEDMTALLTALYRRTLADSASCAQMLEILQQQLYNDMIPRFLPAEECSVFSVAHKTGGINETKVDAGLILSDRADIAMAVFVDKHPDHRGETDNLAQLLAARVARRIWNHFTGMSGSVRTVAAGDVDWTPIPGGSWAIYRSSAAPFPHRDRLQGYTGANGLRYPFWPHYADSSIVVFVPEGARATPEGMNVIVHFHGHMNDNLGVLERSLMLQAVAARKINALLILPQGPYRAIDSFGGKMEDPDGLRFLVEDVLKVMLREKAIPTAAVGRVIISAHGGGERPAAFALDRGGLSGKVTDVFLFDALSAQPAMFRRWLEHDRGRIRAAYTEDLADKHKEFARTLPAAVRGRWSMTATAADHDAVIQTFFADWLTRLDDAWFLPEQ